MHWNVKTLLWIAYDSIRFSNFNPRSRQKQEDIQMEVMGKSTVFAKESKAFRDPRSIVVMDAKALFDGLCSEQSSGDDDRSALEIAIIKESILAVQGRPRWIPHNENPADALTKVDGAHAQPLLRLLQSNHFQIEEEDDVLQRGRQSESRLKLSNRTSVGTSNSLGLWNQIANLVHSNR